MSRFAPAAALAALLSVPALAQTGPTIEIPRPLPNGAPGTLVITPSQPAPGSLRSDNGTPVYRVPESAGGQAAGNENYRAPTTVIPPGSHIIVR